ncbi:MAG TPA: hypothetical protein VK714_10605 [Myxococcota bacterium]|nr:hypothetical protein [Myxococcota bacterium]
MAPNRCDEQAVPRREGTLDVGPVSARRKTVYACLGLAGLTLALYAGALRFDFVNFDDHTVLLAHPELYNGTSLLASLRQISIAGFPREEPLLLRDISWAFDARLFGFANPLGYHLGNVLWNAANSVLVFLFLLRATRRFELALAIAAGFAVLAVHVEPVCWVMGRKDVLSGFFVLAALLAQSFELEQTSPSRRQLCYAVTLAAMVLALFSKIAAMSCVLLLAIHWIFHPYLAGRREPRTPLDWSRILRELVPRYAPHALLTTAIVVWYQHAVAQFGVTGWRGRGPLDPVHLANVASFAPLVIAQYLRSIVWPTQLSIFYRWPHVEIPLTNLQQLAAAAVALVILSGVLFCCRRRRDLAFYVLGFLALLVPYMGIVFVDIWRADRYIYLAALCVLAIPATLLCELHARSGRAMRWAILILAAGFGLGSAAATFNHEAVWQDDDALWSYEAHLKEPSLQAIQSLAKLYVERAENETNAMRRHELLDSAHLEITRGLEHDRVLDRRPNGYATNEQLQLSHLYVLQGRVAAMEGAPLEQQLAAYATAHKIAPNRASAFMLAKIYLQLAGRAPSEEREHLVRTSLDYFIEYIAQSGPDPIQRQRSAAMLATLYEQPYPFLSDEILAARRSYFQ